MTEVVEREAARVLLVDPAERLLLLRFRNPDNDVPFWCPVGGGLDDGETAAEAAVREAREETGLPALDLGPECYHRTVEFPWRGQRFRQHERWFVARVDAFEVDDAGWTDAEREDITAVRWFTATELADLDEATVPLSLATVFADLLRDGPPGVPVDLGF